MSQIILDNTMRDSFHACPKKFYYRHVLHLIKIGASRAPLTFGAAIHAALEVAYKGGTELEAMEAFTEEWDETQADGKRNLKNGLLILQNYFKKFFPERWKVKHVEVPLSFELSSDILYVGRCDLIVDNYMGGRYLVEHKTSSNFRWFTPKPNNQICGYIYGCKVSGIPVDGAVVNLLGVFKTKTEFLRTTTYRDEVDLEEWKLDVFLTKSKIDACLENNHFPVYTHSCWNCEYKGLCTSRGRALERLIEMDYRKEPWEPWKANI